MSIPNRLRRNVALVAILIAAALAPRARATWSVVLTDTATGEVAIASATCINNFDLEFYLPVVRPGIGVAAEVRAKLGRFTSTARTVKELAPSSRGTRRRWVMGVPAGPGWSTVSSSSAWRSSRAAATARRRLASRWWASGAHRPRG